MVIWASLCGCVYIKRSLIEAFVYLLSMAWDAIIKLIQSNGIAKSHHKLSIHKQCSLLTHTLTCSFGVPHPFEPIIFNFCPNDERCVQIQYTGSYWYTLILTWASRGHKIDGFTRKIPTFPRIPLLKRWSINVRMWIDITFLSYPILIGAPVCACASCFVCLFVFVLRVLFYLILYSFITPRKKKVHTNLSFLFFFLSFGSRRSYTDIRICDTVNRHHHDQSHGFWKEGENVEHSFIIRFYLIVNWWIWRILRVKKYAHSPWTHSSKWLKTWFRLVLP